MAGRADTLLKEYKKKRDFSRTAEPSGDVGEGRGKAGIFIVQKHDATRLHYDFRLELDGVLKSWAVTRGPSFNPADKRLAVRVEDHPLDYAEFEGTIPEGQYGGGTVMLWDRGTWEPLGDPHEMLEKGDFKFRLDGERLKGDWVLVHMKGRDQKRRGGETRENWLLIKHRDGHAGTDIDLTEKFTTSVATGRDLEGIAKGNKSRKKATKDEPAAKVWTGGKALALPEWREPQLATLVDTVPVGQDWLFEMKYDGYRCLAAVAGTEVRLYTRTGQDWTDKFAVMREPLSRVTKGTALIDGELVSFDEKGRTDFATLKNHLSFGGPLTFFAFDLLEQDGEDLTGLPLVERKARLAKLLGKTTADDPIQYSEHIRGNGQKMLDALCRQDYEGVVAKLADAPYRGERTRSWLKIKCAKRQEFVIGGWRPSEKKPKTFASLLLGTIEDGKLVYRGRVGTGFNDDDLKALRAAMDKRARKTSPFEDAPRLIARHAKWVEPELVAEIAFTEFTEDGYLRHPSFLGLREDKPADEVTIETPADVPDEAAEPKTKAKPARRPAATGRPKASAALDDKAGLAAAERVGVKLSSPDRVVFPGQGVTKAEIVAYYAAVADRMLPFIANRPLSLLRCPQGRTKYCFFQKHDTGGFPDAMRSIGIAEKDGALEDYFVIDDLAGLIAGTQMNVLEWHLWGSRADDVEHPERLIFDIDPDEGLGFDAVKRAAFDIRDTLAALDLQSVPMVSGGKGIHVIVPLQPKADWDLAKTFSRTLAQRLAGSEPDRFTANMSKAKRKGRLFIDYLRNERGSTAIAPWSIRSREGAPVATPVTWEELESIDRPNGFSLAEAAARAAGLDPWPDYFKLKQAITPRLLKALDDAGK